MTAARKLQNASDLSAEEQQRVRGAIRHLHARVGDWMLRPHAGQRQHGVPRGAVHGRVDQRSAHGAIHAPVDLSLLQAAGSGVGTGYGPSCRGERRASRAVEQSGWVLPETPHAQHGAEVGRTGSRGL